jgi:hypothetical protein
MFVNNQIKPEQMDRAKKIAETIKNVNPHILGICEAANHEKEHEHFLDNYLPESDYKLAKSKSRGAQNLVFYYKDPLKVISVDQKISFYDPWTIDLEDDGIKEHYKWERKPLEIVFELDYTGNKITLIMVHAKSKGVYSVVDLANFQKISYANRKRLVAQSLKLRERLDDLISGDGTPIMVLGDMNDGPGFDSFEALLGNSFIENVMGAVHNPSGIFHNVLWYMNEKASTRKDLWTADFMDPIVNNPLGYKHRVWIDHIVVSPDMLRQENSIKYVMNSGQIYRKGSAWDASDHFPVYCKILTN